MSDSGSKALLDQHLFHEQKDVLNIALDHITMGMVVVGPDYRTLAFNRHFLELFRLPPGTVEVGSDFREILKVWATETGQTQQMLDHAILRLDESSYFEFEFLLRLKGEPRWCRLSHNPLPEAGFVRVFTDVTEEFQAKESLQASQSRLRLILDSTSEGIYGADTNGICTFVNKACLGMLGYECEEDLVGKGIHALIHHTYPDGSPYPKEQCRVRLSTQKGESAHVENEVHWRADGTSIPVEYWSHPMYKNGDIIGSVVSFTDITERKQAEWKLYASEARYRTLAERSPLAIQAFAPDGRFLRANEAWQKIWQVPLSAAQHYNVLEDKQLNEIGVLPLLKKAFAGQTVEFPVHEYDKTKATEVPNFEGKLWLRGYAYPVHGEDGQLLELIVLQEDVTEHVLADAAIKESEIKYRTLFEAANDGIFLLDEHGFIDCNQHGAEMYGRTKAEVIGHSPLDFAPERQPNGRLSAEFTAEVIGTALQGGPQSFEWQCIRADGTTFDVEFTLNRLQVGNQIRFQAIVRDITRRKRMEDELRRLATTDFLTGLSSRRNFINRLEDELARMHRAIGQPVALLLMDLDHFKQVNDSHGHATGDAVLKHFSTLVNDELRRIDLAGRLGGEEFGIILPSADPSAALLYAERLRQRVADSPLVVANQRIAYTVSIGVTLLEATDNDPDTVLARADKALYRAKGQGRNRVEASYGEA